MAPCGHKNTTVTLGRGEGERGKGEDRGGEGRRGEERERRKRGDGAQIVKQRSCVKMSATSQ